MFVGFVEGWICVVLMFCDLMWLHVIWVLFVCLPGYFVNIGCLAILIAIVCT